MRQQLLDLGIVAPADLFICSNIGDQAALEALQPSIVAPAPRGVWLVMRSCWKCTPVAYCNRHDPIRWPGFITRTQKIPALSGLDGPTAGML